MLKNDIFYFLTDLLQVSSSNLSVGDVNNVTPSQVEANDTSNNQTNPVKKNFIIRQLFELYGKEYTGLITDTRTSDGLIFCKIEGEAWKALCKTCDLYKMAE